MEDLMEDIITRRNAELIRNVSDQIKSINDFISWSKGNLAESRRIEVFKKLVDKRRQLKRYLFSLSSNPAIAAFGESQKGKSYVISSLLASKGTQFTVEGKDGKVYNFIEEMNPLTNNTEATGVVTRFTKEYERVDENFPIKVKLLSVADIIQILCDTAHLDVKSHTILPREEINETLRSLQRRYGDMPDIQNFLDEDEIFNIREYVKRYMANEANELLSSEFFDILAQIVRKIQPKDWPGIISKIWYDNPEITSLFRRIIEGYQTVGFASHVCIPISALLNTHNTLMGSVCLQKLESQEPMTDNRDLNIGTDILIYYDGNRKVIPGFSKSLLSAMTAEVVFTIPKESIEEKLSFKIDGITDESLISYLNRRGWSETVTKNFLNTVDILDFPGARSRLLIDESQIPIELTNKMVLRGKVSYLFNKYADEKLINVLMICHDNEQNGSPAMPPILKKWVSDNVGRDAGERSKFIEKSTGSPLFLIATKFNIDLRVDVTESKNERPETRWDDRFSKVVYDQVLMATSNRWFDDWTTEGSFKNTYLLRDFKYSGDSGSGNRLFKGFAENGMETEEYDLEYHRKYKESFLANDNVKKFFDDPELAWDSACTMNNDGTVLIIKNLSTVADKAKESRLYKNKSDIRKIHDVVASVMTEYYHDEDDANILKRAIARSGSIIAEFDVISGRNNYFFGRMIQNLQISENYVFDIYYRELNNTRMISQRDLKEYDLIISRCHGMLSAHNSYEENLEILRQNYHFLNTEDCRNFFENVKQISLERLFECNFKQKSNSQQLAEEIVSRWLEDLKSQKNLKFYESLGCNTLIILDLLENMKAAADSVGLVSVISKKISPFVDAISVPHAILDMIADTTAEIINDFVVTFGYNYYSPEKIAELRQIDQTNGLHLSFDYGMAGKTPKSIDELSMLFDQIRPTEENDTLSSLPSFANYNKWIEMLLISFIASYNIPNYDIEANRKLGELLAVYDALA